MTSTLTLTSIELVTNRGLQERCSAHGRDLTFRLRSFVDRAVLVPHGERQGRWYTLARDHSSVSSSGSSDDSTEEVVREVASTRWVSRARAQQAVLRLCRGRWKTLEALAEALSRKPDTVQRSYLTPLVQAGRLELLHASPTHPEQAYRTVGDSP